MKHFLDILLDIRIAGAEILGTLSLLFLLAYGAVCAYQDFIGRRFK